MKPITLFFLGVVAWASCNDDDNDNKRAVANPDMTFAMNAAMANQAEIQISGLAPDRSTNTAVQGFATHMIDEHTTALNDLKMIVDKTNLTWSSDPDSAHQALKQRLTGLSGIAFDTVFMNSMVKDHVKVIAMFQSESASGTDNELRGYADKYLPHLNEHLATAKQVQSSVMSSTDNSGRKEKE